MDEELYRAAFSRLRTSIDERALTADMTAGRRGGRRRTAVLVLAALLTLALAAGAAAARFGGLQSLVLRGRGEGDAVSAGTAPEAAGDETSAEPPESGADTISLQGFTGSPEYQAVLEWREFERAYDPDGEIMAESGDGGAAYERYAAAGYSVYSGEMAEKLEEIAGRYGLVLHTDSLTPAGIDELRAQFGNFAPSARGGGYYYNDGTIELDGRQEAAGRGEVEFQLRRTAKGVFDTAVLNIADAEQYEQWEYAPARGGTVLLALGPRRALMISETDAALTAVIVCEGSDAGGGDDGTHDGLTRAELEALADGFDFSIL